MTRRLTGYTILLAGFAALLLAGTPAHADMTRKEWLEKYGRLKSDDNEKDSSSSKKSSSKSKSDSSDTKKSGKSDKDRDQDRNDRDRPDKDRDDRYREDDRYRHDDRYRSDHYRYEDRYRYGDRYYYGDRYGSGYRYDPRRSAPYYLGPAVGAGTVIYQERRSGSIPYDGAYYPGYEAGTVYQGRIAGPAPQPGTMDMVTAVQIGLARRGYDPGPPDGKLGTRTRSAIRQYQVANRLPVTGLIDSRLLSSLGLRVAR